MRSFIIPTLLLSRPKRSLDPKEGGISSFCMLLLYDGRTSGSLKAEHAVLQRSCLPSQWQCSGTKCHVSGALVFSLVSWQHRDSRRRSRSKNLYFVARRDDVESVWGNDASCKLKMRQLALPKFRTTFIQHTPMPGHLSDNGHASLQEQEGLIEGNKEAFLQGFGKVPGIKYSTLLIPNGAVLPYNGYCGRPCQLVIKPWIR